MSSNAYAYSLCPCCHRWVPVDYMHYEHKPGCEPERKCSWCAKGLKTPECYVSDIRKVTCIWCDSEDVTPTDRGYHCNSCSEDFIL